VSLTSGRRLYAHLSKWDLGLGSRSPSFPFPVKIYSENGKPGDILLDWVVFRGDGIGV